MDRSVGLPRPRGSPGPDFEPTHLQSKRHGVCVLYRTVGSLTARFRETDSSKLQLPRWKLAGSSWASSGLTCHLEFSTSPLRGHRLHLSPFRKADLVPRCNLSLCTAGCCCCCGLLRHLWESRHPPTAERVSGHKGGVGSLPTSFHCWQAWPSRSLEPTQSIPDCASSPWGAPGAWPNLYDAEHVHLGTAVPADTAAFPAVGRNQPAPIKTLKLGGLLFMHLQIDQSDFNAPQLACTPTENTQTRTRLTGGAIIKLGTSTTLRLQNGLRMPTRNSTLRNPPLDSLRSAQLGEGAAHTSSLPSLRFLVLAPRTSGDGCFFDRKSPTSTSDKSEPLGGYGTCRTALNSWRLHFSGAGVTDTWIKLRAALCVGPHASDDVTEAWAHRSHKLKLFLLFFQSSSSAVL